MRGLIPGSNIVRMENNMETTTMGYVRGYIGVISGRYIYIYMLSCYLDLKPQSLNPSTPNPEIAQVFGPALVEGQGNLLVLRLFGPARIGSLVV